jgi:hypothetical protein
VIEGARTRVALACYLNNPTKITQVISAKAINNVLWPQRAIIPTMSISWIQANRQRPVVRPTSFVGAKLYISSQGPGMSQVSKPAIFRSVGLQIGQAGPMPGP